MTRLAIPAMFAGALIALAPSVATQNQFNFDIEAAASSFTFGGSVTVPIFGSVPIQGNPSNSFNLSGGQDMSLTTGSSLTNGQFAPGAVVTVPSLKAKISILFLGTITMDITGVTVEFTSPTFTVGAGGGFTAQTTATILTGSGAVAGPIVGNQTISLAGTGATPQNISGTIKHGANGFVVNVPININFPFTEPSSGITGNLTLNGTIVGADRSFNVDRRTMSASTGGTQKFTYSAGTAQAGNVFFVLGSVGGTSPGIQLTPSLNLPINFDGWTSTCITFANAGPFFQTVGTLDSMGIGNGSLTLPALPFLAGFTFDHAYLGINGLTPVFVSNAAGLSLQ